MTDHGPAAVPVTGRIGIHPVMVFILAAGTMIGLAVVLESSPPWPVGWSRGLGMGLMAIGTLWNLVQARAFRCAATTLRPGHDPTCLVITGAYAVSRNPMYLGQLVILAGLACLLHAWASWLVLPVTVLVFDRLVIPAEERRIAAALPEAWADYQGQVRRWLGWRRG